MTDGPTDGWTDNASYRVACPQLKKGKEEKTRPSRPIRCDVMIVERMRYRQTDRQTDRQTNQPTNPTDIASYRGALSHLKTFVLDPNQKQTAVSQHKSFFPGLKATLNLRNAKTTASQSFPLRLDDCKVDFGRS